MGEEERNNLFHLRIRAKLSSGVRSSIHSLLSMESNIQNVKPLGEERGAWGKGGGLRVRDRNHTELLPHALKRQSENLILMASICNLHFIPLRNVLQPIAGESLPKLRKEKDISLSVSSINPDTLQVPEV